jgi:hypothetical protein
MFHQWLHLLGHVTKAPEWETIHKTLKITKDFEQHSTPLITPEPTLVVKSSLVIINRFHQFNLQHLGA